MMIFYLFNNLFGKIIIKPYKEIESFEKFLEKNPKFKKGKK